MRFKINFSTQTEASFDRLDVAHQRDVITTILKSYITLNRSLAYQGCAPMPFDPIELLCYADKNGYHSAALNLKRAMIVGKGYDGDPELLQWLDNIETEEGLDAFFNEVAGDMETFGTAYIEVRSGIGTYALYRVPAVKVRIRPASNGNEMSFLQFDYVSRDTGEIQPTGYAEFLPYRSGRSGGIAKLRLPSKSGNYWYGEPEYLSTRDLLAMNVNIVTYAKKLFSQGAMSDMLIIGKGTSISKKVRNNLRAYLQSQFVGLDNAHKIGWLQIGDGEEIQVERLNAMIDRSFSDLRHDNRDEIVAGHQMPPRLVGIIAAGAIGGAGEVEGQLKIVKIALIDPRQKLYESQFKKLFKAMGAPKSETFSFKPLDITAGSLDMQTLAAGVHEGILTAQEANDEWNTEKSAGKLITLLRSLREELARG